MRIIDANTDYYDYLQNVCPDASLVFDRRDSFLLTKQFFCEHLKYEYTPYGNKDNFALLQICNTFWLFRINIVKTDEYRYRPVEYVMELLRTWKNYDKERKLISLDVIDFKYSIYYLFNRKNIKDKQKIFDALEQAVNNNDYRILSSINRFTVYPGNDPTRKIEKHIPLLKACGIANLIDPMDVFLAFEEYFSLEKTSSERRDPVGATDIDKIESHGFDVKTSFRGKQ